MSVLWLPCQRLCQEGAAPFLPPSPARQAPLCLSAHEFAAHCTLQAVALVACELLKMYLMASPALSLAGLARSSDPYVNLLALIYLATKLCYGLDGGAHPRLPHVPPMPCSWPAWADALGRVWGHTTQFPLTPEQVGPACNLTHCGPAIHIC